MLRYDPAGERATRDVVSRGIYAEMRDGRTTPMGGVYIAMAHLGPETVAKKFPGMVKRCADCGFDLAGGLVEVVPTAHYMMGGVEVEADCTTALPGLFVAGEDAGGIHGANRLGGNGVANSTVFGGIAGEVMAGFVRGRALADPDEAAIDDGLARAEAPFARPPGDLHGLRDRLARMMWDKVGILRDRAGLTAALDELAGFRDELARTGLADAERAFNLTWHDWLNLESLIDVSEVIARAALAREDSRGAHFREDFPETGDLAATAFTRVRWAGNDLALETVPVSFDIVRPGESLIDGAIGAPTAAE
jgi:fumarate reductase flavoprotein subunit